INLFPKTERSSYCFFVHQLLFIRCSRSVLGLLPIICSVSSANPGCSFNRKLWHALETGRVVRNRDPHMPSHSSLHKKRSAQKEAHLDIRRHGHVAKRTVYLKKDGQRRFRIGGVLLTSNRGTRTSL